MKNKIKILVFVLFVSITLQLVFGETSNFNNASRGSSYDTLYTYNGTSLKISDGNLSGKTQISSITVIPQYSAAETEEVSLTGWWYGTNTMDWLRELRDELIIDTFGTKHNTYDKTTYYEGEKPKKDWKIYVEQNGNTLYGKSEEMTLTGTLNGNSVSFTGVWNTYRKWENPPCVFTNTYETEEFEGVVSKGGDMYILVGTLTGDRGYYEECHTVEPDYWEDYYKTTDLTWGGTFVTYVEPDAIKVIQLEALDTIKIREYPSEIIWESIEPSKYAPIAFPKSNSFTIRVIVGAPMKPPWKPVGMYKWDIPYTDKYGEGVLNLREIGYYPFFGGEEMFLWQAEFDVNTPDRVGMDKLNFEFKIYDDNGKLINRQTMGHYLYVTYDKSLLPQPKEKWLEKATEWAGGAKTDEDVANFINSVEYNNPLQWKYGYPNQPWYELVEEVIGVRGDIRGECSNFRDVWINLAKVLGVNAMEDVPYIWRMGFMTSNRPALHQDFANAWPSGGSGGDRWLFGAHYYGRYRIAYDSTFGLSGDYNVKNNVFCKIHNPFLDDSAICTTPSLPFENYTIKSLNRENEGGWSEFEYKKQNKTTALKTGGINLMNIFQGKHFINISDYGKDIDNNTLYDYLIIRAEINITNAGKYGIFGLLRKNNEIITVGTLESHPTVSRMGPIIYTNLTNGLNIVYIYYGGIDIYEKRLNGPYTTEMYLYNSNGSSISSSFFNTSYYKYTEFQGMLAEFINISDYGNDPNNNSLFDFLTVKVNLNMIKERNFSIEGILFFNKSSVALVKSIYLDKGGRSINLDFVGQKIYESKTNGPYYLEIKLSDGNYYKIFSYNTSSYKYADFDPELCIEPKNKMLIRENTKFCPGTYSISNGIEIDKDDIILDCNNAVLVGNNFGNGIYLFGQKGVTIKNCIIKYYNNGISLNHSYDTNILFNNMNSNNFGIYLFKSNNNTINNNNISNNIYHGVFAENSLELNIYSNIMRSNGYRGDYGYGTYIRYGSDANIKNNLISNNSATRYAYGIKIKEFSNIIIQDNTISGNKDNAIQIEFSDNITLKDNNLISNKGGIYINSSDKNKVYHNNFVNNNIQAFDNGNNYWDNGIEEGGNYWSNYDENIEGCNDINKDGYCDMPYPIPTKGIDNYPFKKENDWLRTTFFMNLKKGWNLISIPLTLTNNTLPKPLKSIQGNYSKIFTYNNRWIELKNNSKINETIGLWIRMLNNDTLNLEGNEIKDPISNLINGWNLVGYPYLEEKNIFDVFGNVSVVYSYNNSWSSYIPNRSLNPLQTLKPGFGYWVKLS